MWPSRQAELGWIDVMRRPAKNGFASCYCTRFKWALDSGYKVITEMDADLSHDAHVLLRLLSALDEGAGVAVGPRYVPGGIKANWSLGRRALSAPATGTRAGASGAASLTSAQPSALTARKCCVQSTSPPSTPRVIAFSSSLLIPLNARGRGSQGCPCSS